MLEVANFIYTSILSLTTSMLTSWGIIGVSFFGTYFITRVVNFMKRFFK